MAEFESRKQQVPEGRKAASKPALKATAEARNIPIKRQDSSLQSVRAMVGVNFVNFLKKLKWKSLKEVHSQQQQIQNEYGIWADTYKMVHKEFSELWDFFNLVEQDAQGWFRVAPKGTSNFIEINEEGYSFSAGVEENTARGTPMPKKWMIVSLAHSDHWVFGLGDERRLGRPEPINDQLIGLENCSLKDLDKALLAVRELRRRAEETPLMFQMYSDAVGQRGVKIPLNILRERSLIELCKGLFLALNKDTLDDFAPHLPKGTKIELLE